jgi:P4 family phage/plasmid primase-like protien
MYILSTVIDSMFKLPTPNTELKLDDNNKTKGSNNKKMNGKKETAESKKLSSTKTEGYSVSYNNFMKKHLYDKNNKEHSCITNTRIGDKEQNIFGGCYHISQEDYGEFLLHYYAEVFEKKKKEYLTEKQLDANGPLLIDIDLRHDFDIEGRYYTQEHIEDLLDAGYLDILKQIYYFDEETNFNIYVLEKENVNRVKEKNITKDGIHIIIGIQCDHVTQQIIRNQMIKKLEEMWGDFPLKNTWDDVLDSGISTGVTNWQLYGSQKPGYEAYKLTTIYNITYDEDSEDICRKTVPLNQFNLKVDLDKLSARYENHPSYVFNSDFVKFREHAIANGDVVVSDGLGKRNRNSATNLAGGMQSPGVGLTGQSYSMMNSALSLNTILQIKNHADLKRVIDQFLDYLTSSASDYKLKEAYDYTMALPEQYYGEGSYLKWISVGWALRNTSDMLFIVWIAFSAKSKSFHFHDIRSLYEDRWLKFDLNNPDGLTLLSIMRWCKIDAFSEYKKIRENSIDYFIDQSLGIYEKEIIDKPNKGATEFDIAVVLFHYHKSMYKCVGIKSDIWFRYDNHRWVEDESGTTLRKSISLELRDVYRKKSVKLTALRAQEQDETKNKILGAKIDKILDVCMKLAQTTFKKGVMKEAQDLFYDSEFFEKLDANPHLLCFNNGVIDFKTKTFRHGYPEDYITKTTKIDYIPADPVRDAEKIRAIETFMHELFPIQELYTYMWEHLASTLIGVSPNQTFNIYIGDGQNGKSALIKLMALVLGDYKHDASVSIITNSRTKIGGTSPEILNLKGVRYAVMQEPEKGDRINEGTMKQYTSGIDPVEARGLYNKTPTTFIPQLKLVLCCNEFMQIKSQDHGTWRRIRVVDFMSLFTDNPVKGDKIKPYQFKVDHNFTDKFELWKECFAALLVKKAFETNGFVNDCDIVLKASNSYRQGQDFISEFIADRVIESPGRSIEKTELTAEFNSWYQNTYGAKGAPSIKDVQAYMDKKFGKFEIHKCWKNVAINYNRNPVVPPNAMQHTDEDDYDDIDENDL